LLRAAPVLLFLALEIFCLIDVIVSDEDRVRHLPKIAWFLLILFLPFIGSLIWLFVGRPKAATSGGRSPYERPTAAFPEYDRPGRASGVTPESDEEFLRRVRERAEEQRRIAAEQKKARERAEREANGEQDPGTAAGS
jgi:hypothetical protein